MADIEPEKTVAEGITKEAIDLLEDFANRARRGEVTQVVIMALGPSGDEFAIASTGTISLLKTLGALEAAKLHIAADTFE